MGKWVNINDLGTRKCTKVKFNLLEGSAENPFVFSEEYGVFDESKPYAFYFTGHDDTSDWVVDYGRNSGEPQMFNYQEGIYGWVTVTNDMDLWWEWSTPVCYYGYNGNLGDTNNMDFLVWVEEGTEGGDTETDTETITNHLQRIIQAKADIKKALEQKGCFVGDGTIDTYAAIITNWTPSV